MMIRAFQIASIFLLGLSCQKVEELPLNFDLGTPESEFLGVTNDGFGEYSISVPILNLDQVLLKEITMDIGEWDQIAYSDFDFKDGSVVLDLWLVYGDEETLQNTLTFHGSNTAGEKLETSVEYMMERSFGAPSSTH